jgi:hypothetical protein
MFRYSFIYFYIKKDHEYFLNEIRNLKYLCEISLQKFQKNYVKSSFKRKDDIKDYQLKVFFFSLQKSR